MAAVAADGENGARAHSSRVSTSNPDDEMVAQTRGFAAHIVTPPPRAVTEGDRPSPPASPVSSSKATSQPSESRSSSLDDLDRPRSRPAKKKAPVEDSAARGAPPGDDDGENGDGAEENGREEKSASLSVAAAAPPSAAARSPSAAERKEILKMVTRWGHTVDLDPALAGNKRDANPKRRELLKRDLSREIKWIDMMAPEQWARYSDHRLSQYNLKLKERVRKGIPDSFRAEVWARLIGVPQCLRNNQGKFKSLLDEHSAFADVIGRDINRTFPLHILFRRENEHEPAALEVQDKLKQSVGQRSLYHVCCAYSNFDKELGYTQGMGFLAGIFLMYRDEESSFWCLERLLNGERHKLRTLYTPGFPLLQKYYYILDALTKSQLPKVHSHLERHQVHVSMYSTQWFFTCFAYNFPMEVVLRVWDIMLNEGVKILFRVALFMLKHVQAALLRADDFTAVVEVLKRVHEDEVLADADRFISSALSVGISRREIERLSKAFDKAMQKEAEDAARRGNSQKK